MRTLVTEVPGAWEAFYDLTYANMTVAIAILSDALAYSPEHRALRTLSRLAAAATANKDGTRVLQTTQSELAALAGVSRPTIQRLLRQLGSVGILETSYKRIRVLNHERLNGNSLARR
jgi:DNA-binding MurR/RpiR family transcriptional regulator